MTPENIERAARIFDAARRDNCFVDEIPAELGLDNLEDAARVAERVVALSGERVVGFLVGATSPEMQKSLNIGEPYYACILESNLCRSPANLASRNLLTIGLESEVAFTLGADLPARGAACTFFVRHGMRDIFRGKDFGVLELRGGTHLVVTRATAAIAPGREAPFDLMVDDIDEARAEFTGAGVTVTEITRGRIHDTFHIEGPSGYRFAVTSSHAGDRAV